MGVRFGEHIRAFRDHRDVGIRWQSVRQRLDRAVQRRMSVAPQIRMVFRWKPRDITQEPLLGRHQREFLDLYTFLDEVAGVHVEALGTVVDL